LTHVVPEGEALRTYALGLATELTRLAPLTLRATKESTRRLRDSGAAAVDDDLLRTLYGSSDFAEGVAAFVARRAPNWRGE
jgi:enoyl-CoA hydratase/carnithine racemase